jgi:hypothetical protein
VTWIAVDGEPEDAAPTVLGKMGRLGSFYKMLLDPTQLLSARVGFDRAAQIAILDSTGRLRYRGPMDDDLEKPQRSYLREALEAVVAGVPVPLHQVEPKYGCEYSQPPSCDAETLSPKTSTGS